MAIWQLTPVNRTAAEWEQSSYCGPVSVRASSEAEARVTASRAFCPARQQASSDPWTHLSLVTALLVPQSAYISTGPAAVVGPPNALARVLK